jgi:shikimate kinase
MPSLSTFYGIIVYMYFMDNKQHKLPHIHVIKYQEHEVVISIPDGDILEGSIPSSKMKLVQAWIEIHQDELLADWELAVSGEQPYKIEPLR